MDFRAALLEQTSSFGDLVRAALSAEGVTLSSPVVTPDRLPPQLSAFSAILTAIVLACAKLLTLFSD